LSLVAPGAGIAAQAPERAKRTAKARR
jgi:hypothetical protein